jgi:AraC-like DNA-binding protein
MKILDLKMFLTPVKIFPQLVPYIHSCWIFESDFGHPVSSSRVIVPNGCVKIILPFENSIVAVSQHLHQQHSEGRIQFIGMADEPFVVSTNARRSGTLILQLTPQGACRFAPFPLHETNNNIFSFTDVYSIAGLRLEEQIVNSPKPMQKALLLQEFLVKRLTATGPKQQLIDFTISAITNTKGLVTVKKLEKQTGYSKRYLDMLFKEHVGLSPKTLSSVTRFQYFYELWAKNPSPGFYRNEVFRFYYDQAHFIREFKRFSGYTPQQYALTDNEFGRLFYKDEV